MFCFFAAPVVADVSGFVSGVDGAVDADGVFSVDSSALSSDVSFGAASAGNSLHLAQGWNFVSVPKKLSSVCDTAGELFSCVNSSGRSPLMYDASSGHWGLVKAGTSITPLNAYWIYSADEVVVPVSFDTGVHTPAVKKLFEGWNAVGLSAEDAMPAAAVFTGLDWRSYLSWNATEQRFNPAIVRGGSGVYSDANLIRLWDGGWVFMNSSGTYIGYA